MLAVDVFLGIIMEVIVEFRRGVSPEMKSSALFVFPSHEIIVSSSSETTMTSPFFNIPCERIN
jgi:hypothetical protein